VEDLKFISMKITELDLEKLGFQKVVVGPEESGDPEGFYFYEYQLSEDNENLVLVSEDSDEVQDDSWIVQLFDTADYTFTNREDLREFIQMMKKFNKVI
jgi:hypothetical protein